MPNPGIHVYEKATAVAIPAVAEVSIPFVVGLAPVHTAAKPAKANTPVLCTSWDEAVEKLGFSQDWDIYRRPDCARSILSRAAAAQADRPHRRLRQ